MNLPQLELKKITKIYRIGEQSLHALDNIDLTIHPGDYISLMGPSGSGKSTLLNMIGLLDRPDSGDYWLNGQATRELQEEQRAVLRREKIGFVFQSFHLIPRLSALENVELPLMLSQLTPSQRRRQATEQLTALGLSRHIHQLPSELSGGQMQRVAIARALVHQPVILLADEPTGNLDQHSGIEVVEQLEAANERGVTLIVVTHDPQLGRRAQRQLQMSDGHLLTKWAPIHEIG